MSPVDATVASAEGGGYRSRYGIDKLREGNYPVWKWNCQALLEEHEVWDVVTAQVKRPVKEDGQEPLVEDVLAWEKSDRKARRIIGFTVIDELQGPVREAESAKEAWDELEKLHAPNDRQRQFALARQLHSCKMSSIMVLKDHEREFSNIIEALRATGKAMDPMDVITQYLLSLSEEYEAFVQALSLKLEDTWTFNSVKGMVRVEAQRRANAVTDVVLNKPDPQAVKANFAKGKKDGG
jgi:gag-polypeptide of LTR copia-type